MSNCWIEFEHPEQRSRDDVGCQHWQRDPKEDEPPWNAIERRGFERLGRQGAQAGQKQDHDEWRVDPDVDENHGEQGGARVGRPLEIVEPEELHKIRQDAEVRVGHQLPHERRDRRRGHERQKKQDRDDVIDPCLLLQKHGDRQAENELDPDRQRRVFERHLNGVPELAVRQKVDVVLEPDEPPHHRQVQTITLQGIIDSGDEGNQNPDADEQRRQAEQIWQVIDPPTRWRVGVLDCSVSHKTSLTCDP